MSGAEEEEEKKKERRRAEEVFLFPDVKERRAPNSDRQVSVVSVRKNTEAVRDDEQDHLSALFMIAALHNEKLLPPPPIRLSLLPQRLSSPRSTPESSLHSQPARRNT